MFRENDETGHLNDKKIYIKNLYVAQIKRYLRPGDDITYPFILVVGKASGYRVVDVFSKTKYNVIDTNSINIKNGEICVRIVAPLNSYLISYLSSDIFKNIWKWLYNGWIYKSTLIEFLEHINKKYEEEKEKEKRYLDDDKFIDDEMSSTSSDNKQSEELKYGKILTDEVFKCEPLFGREAELKDIIITLAQLKKNPILVGEPGVGKTTLVDELAYLIQHGNVPNFLKGKKIVEVDVGEILAGTEYRGFLEKKVMAIIKYVLDNNAILFIDEIHRIYGAGATSKSNNDMADIIKHAIDRENIKVIGTTTQVEYERYFSSDALKRRFEVIKISEPDDVLMNGIIKNVLDFYSKQYNISIEKLDVKYLSGVLTNLTKKQHRNYLDKVCNPDLTIAIIDKAFALAMIENQAYITLDYFEQVISQNQRLYKTAIDNAILELESYKPSQNEAQKVIRMFDKKY